ncbi:MAG: 50S ribosomal protein L5 [Leptospiraceae bacterium]|nr:50S ribosomal protein L5 [Leptospiraceae bacterium]
MPAPRLKEKYLKEVKPMLMEKYKYGSTMQTPRLEKIVLNVGMGDGHTNPKALDSALDTLGLVTGQKAVKTKAKKAISNFKLRENMNIGCMVTLRGDRMYEFLDRFVNVALPRVRDFKGVNPKGFDGRGNFNMGIKEQIIFPEIQIDKVHGVHGMNISIITSAKTNQEAFDLIKALGMPYKK